MKKSLFFAGLAAASVMFGADCFALTPYVGAKLKYVKMTPDVKLTEGMGTYNIDDNIYGGSFAVGLSEQVFGGSFRAEVEYNKNGKAEQKHYIGFDDFGYLWDEDFKLQVETQSVMINGYYDFDTGTRLSPYFGAGIGYGEVKGTLSIAGVKAGIKDKKMVWQIGTGISLEVTENFKAEVGYRYMDYGYFKKDGDKVKTDAQELYIGFRYHF